MLARPIANVQDDGKSAYCVYIGKSGSTGGVELDVYYPAAGTLAEAAQVFKTVLNVDPGATFRPEGVIGADESVYALVPQAGRFPYAANAVRRGDLVFSISMPSGPATRKEMLQLSQRVLERLK